MRKVLVKGSLGLISGLHES
jgi:hypothetical protein